MRKIRKLDPSVVVHNAQLKAMESVLLKTYEFFERKVRRWFSKNFATPYMDTFNIPWEEILLHYYESSLEKLSYNEVYDLTVSEFLPEFMEEAEKEDQAFADSLLEEQKAIMKKQEQKAKQAQALKQATEQMANGAANVLEKAQSLKKALDNLPKPKTMSRKFESDDEGDEDSE